MAISGGTNHVLALERDGTVVGWGSFYWGVPPELADVVAISAGAMFDLALKRTAQSSPGDQKMQPAAKQMCLLGLAMSSRSPQEPARACAEERRHRRCLGK